MKSSGAYRQERTNLSRLEFDDDRDYGILPVAYYKNSSYRVFFEAERKRLEKDYNGGELKLYLYEAYKSRNTMEAKETFSVEPRREIYSGRYKTIKGLMQTLNKVDAINWNTPVNYDPFHGIKKSDLLVLVAKDGQSLTNFDNYGKIDSDDQVTFAFSYYGNMCWGKQIYRNAFEASELDEIYKLWFEREKAGEKHEDFVKLGDRLFGEENRLPSEVLKQMLKGTK